MIYALFVVLIVGFLGLYWLQYRMMKQLMEHTKRLTGLVQARQTRITQQSHAAQVGVKPVRESPSSGRQARGVRVRKVGGESE